MEKDAIMFFDIGIIITGITTLYKPFKIQSIWML